MFQKIMFKPGKKSAPGAEKKKKKRNKQDETTEVVDDMPFKKMSSSICHTVRSWWYAMPLMVCIYRRMCLITPPVCWGYQGR